MTRTMRIVGRIALVIVVVAVGITTYYYQRDIRALRDRVTSGSKVIQTACGPIEYAVAGKGSPVLVVHGAGGGFDQGLEIGANLVEHGFRVIAMSRFGYLQTPLPAKATPAAQADAHACLLDALKIRRVAVLGASAGAPSSLRFAIQYPKRTAALVLMVPGVPLKAPDFQRESMTESRGPGFLFDAALRSDFILWSGIRLAPNLMTRALLGTDPRLLAQAGSQDKARVKMLLDHVLPVSQRRVGLLNDARVMAAPEAYPLQKVSAPTLTVSAKDDFYRTYKIAKYIAAHIPHARFLSYPDGGHMLVGHQQESNDEIVRFLNKHPAEN